MNWYRQGEGGFFLSLHIQPGAKKNEVAGQYGSALKIRLTAPPVEGKANAALLDFVAKRLKRPKSAVCLKSGQTSRQKVVWVEDVEETALLQMATSV
jgi:uncharacterized protein (TIGR00251 family)